MNTDSFWRAAQGSWPLVHAAVAARLAVQASGLRACTELLPYDIWSVATFS